MTENFINEIQNREHDSYTFPPRTEPIYFPIQNEPRLAKSEPGGFCWLKQYNRKSCVHKYEKIETTQCTQFNDTNKDEIQIQKDPRLGKTAPHCVDFVDWGDARQDYNE